MVVAFWLIGFAGGLANMMPVLLKRVPVLRHPVDGGLTINGKRLLGDNKTWRGFLGGILGGLIGVALLALIMGLSLSIQSIFLGGIAIGAGALIGDMVGSFLKRQFGMRPGQAAHIIDQIDWIIGAWLCYNIIASASLLTLIILIVIFVPLHYLTNIIGYKLGLKKVWW